MSRPKPADLLQLFVRNVGFDLEIDADSLVSIANVFVQLKKSVQIKISFQGRFDFFDLNAARRRVVNHRRSQTRCQCVKQMLDGIGTGVFPEENRRLIRLQYKRLRPRLLLAGAVKQVGGATSSLQYSWHSRQPRPLRPSHLEADPSAC